MKKTIIAVATISTMAVATTSCGGRSYTRYEEPYDRDVALVKTGAEYALKGVKHGGKIALDATEQANTPVGETASYRHFDERAAQRKHRETIEKETTIRMENQNTFWNQIWGTATGNKAIG